MAYATSAPQDPILIEVTMDGNNTIIRATMEDKIEVRLLGKPTTGYRWEEYALEGDAILQDGEPYYVPDHSSPGAPGQFTFPYRAYKAGDAYLRIVEARSWDTAPISVFYCHFLVS